MEINNDKKLIFKVTNDNNESFLVWSTDEQTAKYDVNRLCERQKAADQRFDVIEIIRNPDTTNFSVIDISNKIIFLQQYSGSIIHITYAGNEYSLSLCKAERLKY